MLSKSAYVNRRENLKVTVLFRPTDNCQVEKNKADLIDSPSAAHT